MASDEVLRLARLSFGGHDQTNEDCREARDTTDPIIFSTVALPQLVVAALACYLPARKQ
jgi:hypothetical protein